MVAYLDHAATTPMRPEAAEAMIPWLTTYFGNPSGAHSISRHARLAVDESRERVAGALGCQPGEVVFTAGGTEADNLAIAGSLGGARRTALCSAVEHHAVLHSVEAASGSVVPVDAKGVIDLDGLGAALSPDVAVVSVMLANNEVGVVQPLERVAEIIRERAPDAVLHTDAVQAVSWLDVDQAAAPAQMVAVAGHKFGGPKGVGALVVRGGVSLHPMMRGGGQERDRRSGTHNVAGIVGMATALEVTVTHRRVTAERVEALRDRLVRAVMEGVPDAIETGAGSCRLPNIVHLRIPGVESEALLMLLDDAGVCASAGSACASGALEPSHVLLAMGIDRVDASSSVRLSLGWSSTADDVDHAANALTQATRRLRS